MLAWATDQDTVSKQNKKMSVLSKLIHKLNIIPIKFPSDFFGRNWQADSKIIVFFCCTGAWTQGLHLKPLHQPFLCVCVMVFSKLGSWELFARAVFETPASWSLPPE
jgi:hypothetical protein